jgi:enoyl-CoA hydratase/carnithine racemase
MLILFNIDVDVGPARRHTEEAGTLIGGRMAAVELTSVDDGVLQITLRRPQALNALNYPMVLDFLAVLDEVESCAGLRAVILTGAGRAFCAGFDLRGYGDQERLAQQGQVRGLLSRQDQIATIPVRLHQLPVPVIAAVNGAAAGAGLSLAAACDIRVAAEGAIFSCAFLRAGFTGCDLGSSWLLPRIIGAGRAHELILTARRFDAAEALTIGLLSRVVPAESLLASALATATAIKQNPPLSVALTKQGMWVALETPALAATVQFENRQQVLSALTEDQPEAALSFLEKRPPRYANR